MKPNICIIAAGGLKEDYLLAAARHYISRLKNVCDISVIETPDEPAPENLSEAKRCVILAREGERISNRFMPSDIIASLTAGGRLADLSFFQTLINKAVFERRRLVFVIGGSFGLTESLLRQSDYAISLSRFTFPHRLARLALMEILCQINRPGR